MLTPPVRVSFVCSGNICRSPTAEVVLIAQAADTGRSELVQVDSSGTGAWHAGDDMDARSRQTLVEAGFAPPLHVAKQFQPSDFADRDVVVALDSGHRNVLWWLAAETGDPAAARAKIVMLRAFDPQSRGADDSDVGDPYYGDGGGFTEVLQQVERGCAGLLDAIAQAVQSGGELTQQTPKPPL